MKSCKVSVLIPYYNENLKLIKQTIKRVEAYLRKRGVTYEIIISQNGGKRRVPGLGKKIILLSDSRKGLGLAIKNAVKKARGDYFYFLPADIPFNFTDLEQMLKLSSSFDFIAGSKLHPKSIYQINFLRKLLTLLQQKITSFLLPGLPITDTSGTYFGNLRRVKRFILETKSNDFFFGTELIHKLYFHRFKMTEVPVIYNKLNSKTSVNIIKDGSSNLIQLLKLSIQKPHEN